jgi:predicted SAM-dependent methyltransferase
MIKLNLGCGRYPKDDFINVDSANFWAEICVWRSQGQPLFCFLQRDYKDKFPEISDGIVDGVTTSHSLMYLWVDQYEECFKEIYRMLKDGGVLRITEDNCENPPELLKQFNLPWGDCPSKVGPIAMRIELEKVFNKVYDVSPTQTYFCDSSLIQTLHGDVPRVFHMEAIK